MIATALALAALAVILAWPAPVALARARWTRRAPGTALLLWQAIALAGGLSMIGALLCAGLDYAGVELLHAATAALDGSAGPAPVPNAIALVAAGVLAVYLLVRLVQTVVAVERQRRRHREILSLLSAPSDEYVDLLLLDDDGPVAYCLPVGLRTFTVLSRGMLARVGGSQLAAVIAHERAHVEQRHDVVLVAFRAWRAALPFLPTARLAQEQVALLVELLADDRALRVVSRQALAEAISTVADASAGAPLEQDAPPEESGPADASAAGRRIATPHATGEASTAVARIRRLVTPEPALGPAATWAARLAAVALVLAPTLYLVAPTVV